jgi:hypothetical protein
MKKQSLEETIKRGARARHGLIVPGQATKRNWPLCMTCGRDVEATELKNINSKSCEIWARCHGAEDYIRIEWDVPVRDVSVDPMEDKNNGWAVRRAMGDWVPFDPHHIFDCRKL